MYNENNVIGGIILDCHCLEWRYANDCIQIHDIQDIKVVIIGIITHTYTHSSTSDTMTHQCLWSQWKWNDKMNQWDFLIEKDHQVLSERQFFSENERRQILFSSSIDDSWFLWNRICSLCKMILLFFLSSVAYNEKKEITKEDQIKRLTSDFVTISF